MTFDAYQQTFVLDLAANCGSGLKGSASDIAKQVRQRLTDFLGTPDVQALMGNWSLIWGPAVWEHPLNLRGYCDNTVVVFRNNASNTIVCAIAATNPYSILDWAVEDLWVSDKVRWLFNPAAGVPWISAATNFGIGMLSALTDPTTGTYLADYLAGIAATDQTLIFTGHSLAGALSPTLAMVLYGTAAARAKWGQVLVYPTAGASPGNEAFSQAFAQQFPAQALSGGQPWQKWNTLLWNDLDVVPHAWSPATMALIPSLYKLSGGVKLTILGATAYALTQAGLDYRAIPNSAFSGTQHAPGTISTLKDFVVELTYQHVTAYYALTGTTAIEPFMQEAQTQAVDEAVATLERVAALAEQNGAAIDKAGVRALMK